MRDLPGLYWDAERNRYFPVGSKPAAPLATASQSAVARPQRSLREFKSSGGPSTSSETGVQAPISTNRKRASGSWGVNERLKGSVFSVQTRRCVRELLCAQLACTSRVTKIPVPDPAHSSITAFKTVTVNDCTKMFYGDTNGWLYSYTGCPGDPPECEFWARELNLISEISSICISDSRCVATSFGPSPKILVQDLASTNISILSPGKSEVHDIWSSHLRGRGLALGANKKAIFLKDLDTSRSTQVLDTQSDVFAVEQQENLVYTGARNGSIARFDTRVDDPNGQRLLNGLSKAQGVNSITKLHIVRDWQLVVANINGCLASYDLRFVRGSTPLLVFTGHVNSYSTKLALTVDPSENFLFAAGQDMCIRAWSLQTGEGLIPPSASKRGNGDNPFSTVFSQPITAMQVTEERNEMLLWAASDKDLYRYHLGQQGH